MNWRVAGLFLGAAVVVWGQASATLRGTVLDGRGDAITAATVILQNHLTGYKVQSSSASDGTFQILNIPFHSYELIVSKEGFAVSAQTASLRTNLPQELVIR